jgi:membrane peptidoglycan carboxypeptidase
MVSRIGRPRQAGSTTGGAGTTSKSRASGKGGGGKGGGGNPWPRRLIRTGKIGGVVLAVLVVLFGVGWVITPSVGQAPEIVLQQAIAYHISYPGAPVPQNFARALIATEDHRFASEPGVDPFAVARVAEAKITGRQDQGGATIEQQLAKMLYTPGHSAGMMTELEQVILAFKLNMSYSKTQILQMYSEVAYYGHGFYGLQTASCGYFGVQPSRLSVGQAAMLAGAVNAPSVDDPILHPAAARARLEHVISRMVAVGYLTVPQAAHVLNTPLGLVSVPGCR